METRFEGLRRKYRDAKREDSNVDLLLLKSEIEFFIRDLQSAEQKDENMLDEARDMLIDVTRLIEEGHCRPFRPKL
ncbi:MAG: hypothetical protein QXN63_03975 [Candidatus Bathyarchaeia archaeon]